MKRLLICLSIVAGIWQEAAALEWLTDLPTALARAKKENKAVLLDFTGSDWCGWCMKLKSEVFDQFEFAGYANANLIMVEVDFPRRKILSVEQMNANSLLAVTCAIKGYPTIVVLNAKEQVLGRTGYVEGGPSAFIARLESFPGMPHHGGYVRQVPAPAATNAPPAGSARQPAVAPPAPNPYGELTLKGMFGRADRRMVQINNEMLMAGDTARVRSFDTNVTVTVKEIRENSAIILVNGQNRELKLGNR